MFFYIKYTSFNDFHVFILFLIFSVYKDNGSPLATIAQPKDVLKIKLTLQSTYTVFNKSFNVYSVKLINIYTTIQIMNSLLEHVIRHTYMSVWSTIRRSEITRNVDDVKNVSLVNIVVRQFVLRVIVKRLSYSYRDKV